MSSVNKAILIGNLGVDPDLKFTPNGQPVCNFSLATNESWKDKNGEKQERTEWHRIVVWGKLAEVCAKYLSKGRQAYIEGRIQTRSWDDKDGKGKRYMTEIVADGVKFLGGGDSEGSRSGSGGGGARDRDDSPPPNRGSGPDDDIPF